MDSVGSGDSHRERLAPALVYAAIAAHDLEVEAEREAFFDSARRGRPEVRAEMGREVELLHEDSVGRLRIFRIGRSEYLAETAGQRVHVELERGEGAASTMRLGNLRHRVAHSSSDGEYVVEVDGETFHFTMGGGGIVRCPAPSVILSVEVSPGDHVEAGDVLVLLEAMKMETSLVSPREGTVAEVFVVPNDQVGRGDELVRLGSDGLSPAVALDLSSLSDKAPIKASSCLEAVEGLRRLLLGFDIDPDQARRIENDWHTLCGDSLEPEPSLLEAEEDVLEVFADTCALWSGTTLDEGDGELLTSHREDLLAFLADPAPDLGAPLSDDFALKLSRALLHYRISNAAWSEEVREALFRLYKAHERTEQYAGLIVAILERRRARPGDGRGTGGDALRNILDRLVAATRGKYPAVEDLGREVRYRNFDEPLLERVLESAYETARRDLEHLEADPGAPDREERIARLVACPQPLMRFLTDLARDSSETTKALMLEVMTRRYYRIRPLEELQTGRFDGLMVFGGEYEHEGVRVHLLTTFSDAAAIDGALDGLVRAVKEVPPDRDVIVDLYVWQERRPSDPDGTVRRLRDKLSSRPWPRPLRRIVFSISTPGYGLGEAATEHFTFRPSTGGYVEEERDRGLHPMMGKRLGLWRLENFKIRRLRSVEDVYLFHGIAYDNPGDERLFVFAEVRDLTPVRDESGKLVALPYLERIFNEALAGMRLFQARRPPGKRLVWNRIFLYLWPTIEYDWDELLTIVGKLAPLTEGLGLHKVDVWVKVPDATGTTADLVMHVSNPAGRGVQVRFAPPEDRAIHTLNEYDQKVVKMRQRGLTYPYEIVRMLTPEWTSATSIPRGEFVEYDLSEDGLVPVERPFGENRANVVVGVIRNFTDAYPEGMARVILLGDPSKALGSLAEPECRRIISALDLAEQMGVPLEWFAVSAGAKIAMDSGTENMDWIASVLRRLIEFTQSGGEVNIVVCGINVGAQPYWNAEATMLMHTRGILIMTSDGAMVLTGKQALDYSGGVSAEDNFGIGGYDRVMGPNGQAQYWARDVHDACGILLQYYRHTYVLRGERFPRRKQTSDPIDRDVRDHPHLHEVGAPFEVVGEIFSSESNASRKKPFDIRSVMRAASDQDFEPLERWAHMRDAEIAVVWDAHLGGRPVCLIGIESKLVRRRGTASADGPEQWTAGTLFPHSSKKIARAVNAAGGRRPLVVLANLSGFDGSPESMRNLQLEFGAEIGRAVVNFDGPIVFCVVSRYHGGAFVVFSAKLNEHMEVAAIEGSFASVIGGAPAAAVVFAREVTARTAADPRVKSLDEKLAEAEGAAKPELGLRLQRLTEEVRSEKLGEVASEFDAVHSVLRAQRVGSVHHIIPAARLRPYLVDAVERGIGRYLGHGDTVGE